MADPPKERGKVPRFSDPFSAKLIELAMGEGLDGIPASLIRFTEDARALLELGDRLKEIAATFKETNQTMRDAILALQDHARALREFTEQFKGSP